MEIFGVGLLKRNMTFRCRKQIHSTLVESIVHLGDDVFELAIGVIEIPERRRAEFVAKEARGREEIHMRVRRWIEVLIGQPFISKLGA